MEKKSIRRNYKMKNKKTRERTEPIPCNWLTSLLTRLILFNRNSYINLSIQNSSAGMAEPGQMRSVDARSTYTSSGGSKVSFRDSLSQRFFIKP